MPAPHRSQSLIRSLLQALMGLIGLTVMLVGLPVGLLRFGTLPTSLPSPGGAWDALLSPDDGTLLLTVLTLIAWACWAAFAASTLIELTALLRRRTARRVRGLGSMQGAAAFLLSSIVLVGVPAAASAATVSPAAAVSAPATPGPTTAAPTTTHQASTLIETGVKHRIGTGTTWWALAEDQLGDGLRWRDIADLNPDLPASADLPAGTTVVLPANARAATGHLAQTPASADDDAHTTAATAHTHQPHTSSAKPATTTYTVVSGDTLSEIAEHKLGDAAQYPKIFALNERQPQPHGLPEITDEDEIYPGQHLNLPAQSAAPEQAKPTAPSKDTATPSPAPTEHPHPAAPAPHASDNAPAPGPTTTTPTATPTPEADHPTPSTTPETDRQAVTPTPNTTSAPPTTSPDTPTSPSASDHPNSAPTAGASPAVPATILGGVAALLAAGLLSALGVKRILQQRRRRPGQTIATPDEPNHLEQALPAVAEPASVALLDTALRTLAHHASVDGQPLPRLRGARVTARTVEVLADDGSDSPLTPFKASGKQGGWWTLDDGALLLDADTARQVPAPYPGLVTLGTDDDGSLLLVHLPHVRALLFDGPEPDVRAVARAIALEAATSAWADHAEILTVGLGSDIDNLLPQGRLRALPHAGHAIRDLGEMLLEAHQFASEPDQPTALPWMLICAADLTDEHAWQLADALATAQHFPVAVVLAGTDTARSAFPDAEWLDAALDTPQPCETLTSDLLLQRLTDEAYEQAVQALQITEEPARPAEGAWQLVPDPERPRPRGPLTVPAPSSTPPDAAGDTPFPALMASIDPSPIPVGEASPNTPTEPDAREAADPKADSPSTESAAAVPTDDEDPNAPEIRLLGPVTVTGIPSSGHGAKMAALAALIYCKPRRDIASLCEAMDPTSPWHNRTLIARLSELRSRLGQAPDGELYFPRNNTGVYWLSPAVRCDWTRFQQLAKRGLTAGPRTGIADLEAALELVRGRPFAGRDYPWAGPLQQEMISRICDVAHALAVWHNPQDGSVAPDLDAARRAIAVGLEVEETCELLYRDWMRIEHAAGNRAGIHTAIAQLQQANRRHDLGLEPETEQTIQDLLAEPAAASSRAR